MAASGRRHTYNPRGPLRRRCGSWQSGSESKTQQSWSRCVAAAPSKMLSSRLRAKSQQAAISKAERTRDKAHKTANTAVEQNATTQQQYANLAGRLCVQEAAVAAMRSELRAAKKVAGEARRELERVHTGLPGAKDWAVAQALHAEEVAGARERAAAAAAVADARADVQRAQESEASALAHASDAEAAEKDAGAAAKDIRKRAQAAEGGARRLRHSHGGARAARRGAIRAHVAAMNVGCGGSFAGAASFTSAGGSAGSSDDDEDYGTTTRRRVRAAKPKPAGVL